MTQAVGGAAALSALLDSDDNREKLRQVAANPADVERQIRLAIREISAGPAAECSRQSIMQSAIDAVALGLSFSKALGEAYVLPFKGSAQLVIGYRGYLKLARNSGEIVSINCDVIREGEPFEHEWRETGPHFRHSVPRPRGNGRVVGAWAMATMRSGPPQIAVMDIEEIESIRNSSSGYQAAIKYKKDSPWLTDPDEMAKKTTIRRLWKLLPCSTTAMRLASEHEAKIDEVLDMIDTEAPKRGIEGAKAKLAAKNGAAMAAQAPQPADDEVPFDPADAPQTVPVDVADVPQADPALDLIEFAATEWGVARKLAETRLEDHSMRFGKKPLRERSAETLAGFYKQVASGALEYREPRSRATPQAG